MRVAVETLPGLRKRVMQGLGGHAYSKAATILVQLAAVPMFLSVWGVELYGEWLILTAISSYLAVADLGFASATASEMGMKLKSDARAQALEAYHSSWCLLGLIGIVAALGFAAFAFLAPVGSWFGLSHVKPFQITLVLIGTGLSSLVVLFTGLFLAGLQSIGLYGLAAFLAGTKLIMEFALLAVVVFAGRGPVTAAFALFFAGLAHLLLSGLVVSWVAPWLRAGIRYRRAATMRRLLSPGMAFVGYAMGRNLLIVQGSRMVVGATLGPSAVTVFVTITTLTSVIRQATSTVNQIVRPELSSAFGTGDVALARSLHRGACQASLWLAIVILVPLGVGGSSILEAWTRGRVETDVWFYSAQLAAAAIGALWSTSAMTLTATNRHQRVAVALMMAAAAGLGFGGALTSEMGLAGMAFGLMTIETVMLAYVIPTSLKLVGDQAGCFARTVIRPPAWLILWLFRRPVAQPVH